MQMMVQGSKVTQLNDQESDIPGKNLDKLKQCLQREVVCTLLWYLILDTFRVCSHLPKL